MGSKGSALANAVIESFFSTLKRELVNRCSWPTKPDARVAVFEWIEAFYNRQRIHTTLGGYAPEEFEKLSLDPAKEAARESSRKLSTETGQGQLPPTGSYPTDRTHPAVKRPRSPAGT